MSPLTLRAAVLLGIGGAVAAAACGHTPASAPRSGSSSTPLASASSTEPRVDRIMVGAESIAAIAAGDPDRGGAMPNAIVLGRADKRVRLFLRFPLRLPKTGSLRSATLLLSRTDDVDMAPAPVELHVARVVDPWDPRSITWPFQPRMEDVRAPHATVLATGPKIVRLDVRPIVQDWPLRDPKDQGLVVVSDVESASGTSFAYLSESARPPELEILWAFPDVDPPAADAGGADLGIDKHAPKKR